VTALVPLVPLSSRRVPKILQPETVATCTITKHIIHHCVKTNSSQKEKDKKRENKLKKNLSSCQNKTVLRKKKKKRNYKKKINK
jgi:hypothetical protein